MLKINASAVLSAQKQELARKEQILQEIQYYEKRIQEFSTRKPSVYYSSSDSEDDNSLSPFPLTLDVAPTVGALKQQDRLLKTCLQATQELTGLGVLQSEVNVVVTEPSIEGERPVMEPGTWREVTAECRIDLVPFSITFYTHQPSRRFSACSYRGVRVLAVKSAQEAELSRSVLAAQRRPSDAVEVLRSYASAYRSRRTTLARLADKYANSLFMEPLSDGGFVLKCANLLSMSWTLENKHSAVAAFHHKMSFELDYMDESYLKTIKQAHRQLADPSLQTDERTLILSKIISTCLESQTSAPDAYESMESDAESSRKHEKTTLSEDIDDNDDIDKRSRDKEVMAPPKTIPKKAKPKGKENKDDNRKSVKRASEVDGVDAKKAKLDSDVVSKTITDLVNDMGKSDGNKNKDKNKKDTGVVDEENNAKNSDKVVDKEQKKQETTEKASKEQNSQKSSDRVVNKEQKKDKMTEKVSREDVTQKKPKKDVDKGVIVDKGLEKSTKPNKNVAKNVEKPVISDNTEMNKKNSEKIVKNNDKKTEKVQKQSKDTNKQDKQKSNDVENVSEKVKEKISHNTEKKTNAENNKKIGLVNAKNTKEDAVTQSKKSLEKDGYAKKGAKDDKKAKNSQGDQKTEKSKAISKTDPKTVKTDSQSVKTTKMASDTAKNDKENKNDNAKNPKNDKVISNKPKEKSNAEKANNITEKNKPAALPKNEPKKPFQKDIAKNKSADAKSKMSDAKIKMADAKIKMAANPKMADAKHKIADATQQNLAKTKVKPKMFLPNHRKSSGGGKKFTTKTFVSKESKIPQKLSTSYVTVLQKNAVRSSPRMMSKFKSSSDTNIQPKLIKAVTNIPRLLKKPAPQSK